MGVGTYIQLSFKLRIKIVVIKLFLMFYLPAPPLRVYYGQLPYPSVAQSPRPKE